MREAFPPISAWEEVKEAQKRPCAHRKNLLTFKLTVSTAKTLRQGSGWGGYHHLPSTTKCISRRLLRISEEERQNGEQSCGIVVC